jgi:hypothetical protein
MKESDVKTLLNDQIVSGIDGATLVISKREPISRYKHQAHFAIIFDADETKENETIQKLKEISFENPDIEFGGMVVDDKFNLKYVAIEAVATIY